MSGYHEHEVETPTKGKGKAPVRQHTPRQHVLGYSPARATSSRARYRRRAIEEVSEEEHEEALRSSADDESEEDEQPVQTEYERFQEIERRAKEEAKRLVAERNKTEAAE